MAKSAPTSSYVTKDGRTVQATAKQISAWTKGSRGAGIQIHVDDRLAKIMRKRSDEARQVCTAGLVRIGQAFEQEWQRKAKGARFKQSGTYVVDGHDVVAGSVSPLAAILENGRRPGRRPSTQSLQAQHGMSLAAAERMADTIAARGTRGIHTVRKVGGQLLRDGTIERIARETLVEIGDLGRGR